MNITYRMQEVVVDLHQRATWGGATYPTLALAEAAIDRWYEGPLVAIEVVRQIAPFVLVRGGRSDAALGDSPYLYVKAMAIVRGERVVGEARFHDPGIKPADKAGDFDGQLVHLLAQALEHLRGQVEGKVPPSWDERPAGIGGGKREALLLLAARDAVLDIDMRRLRRASPLEDPKRKEKKPK